VKLTLKLAQVFSVLQEESVSAYNALDIAFSAAEGMAGLVGDLTLSQEILHNMTIQEAEKQAKWRDSIMDEWMTLANNICSNSLTIFHLGRRFPSNRCLKLKMRLQINVICLVFRNT